MLNLGFFPSEMLTVDYIAEFGCNLISFLFIRTLHINCLNIDDLLPRRRSRAEFGLVLYTDMSSGPVKAHCVVLQR